VSSGFVGASRSPVHHSVGAKWFFRSILTSDSPACIFQRCESRTPLHLEPVREAQAIRQLQVSTFLGPSALQLPFLCEYLCRQRSIPRCDECRRLKRKDIDCRTGGSRTCSPHNLAALKRRTQLLRKLPTWKNRLACGAARDRQLLCQRRRRIPFCPFANRPTESLAVILSARLSPLLECAT